MSKVGLAALAICPPGPFAYAHSRSRSLQSAGLACGAGQSCRSSRERILPSARGQRASPESCRDRSPRRHLVIIITGTEPGDNDDGDDLLRAHSLRDHHSGRRSRKAVALHRRPPLMIDLLGTADAVRVSWWADTGVMTDPAPPWIPRPPWMTTIRGPIWGSQPRVMAQNPKKTEKTGVAIVSRLGELLNTQKNSGFSPPPGGTPLGGGPRGVSGDPPFLYILCY